jgi:glutamine phosphoribosylpyrophosphate amidotransferase
MCGLMGFMGNPDRRLVDALILKARRRGPDSFGIAWRTTCQGHQAIERQLTPSWPAPYRVTLPPGDLAWGIGHARLTTSGRGIENAQPLQVSDLVFAHNGTVYEPQVLAAVYGLPLIGANDSEALGRLFISSGYDAARTMEWLAEHHEGRNVPHAWVAALPTRMWLVAWGHPLHVTEAGKVRYISSWPFPGSSQLRAGTVLTWEVS